MENWLMQGLYCVADTLICNLSATVSATLQLFINYCITRVWLQVADVFMFFNFIVGGLRIKIRVTTVSHKTNSPLCPPCPLW